MFFLEGGEGVGGGVFLNCVGGSLYQDEVYFDIRFKSF